MKLVLLGGVKGVGKSTLISRLKEEFGEEIIFLDPGELFRQYCYNDKSKTADEVEELITDRILGMPSDAIVVIHWHYAVVRPGRVYVPQISLLRLERMLHRVRIEQVMLVLLEASAKVIRARRIKDANRKERAISLEEIAEEMRCEEVFLLRHREFFVGMLGDKRVDVCRLKI